MEHTGYKPLEQTVIDSLLTQAEVLIEQVKSLEVLDRNDLSNCDTIMSRFLDPVNHREQGATGKYFQMVELGKYYYRDIERREVWFDENNAECLRDAIDLLKNVKKEYEEFVQALSGVKERKEQHDSESKTWTVTKSLFGIGSVAKYTNMTRDIPKSLYFIMLVFAFAILYFESVFIERCKHYRQQLKKTQKYYTGINIQEMKNIATPYAIYKECYRLLSESSDNPVSSVKKFIDDNIHHVFSRVDPTDKNTDISTGAVQSTGADLSTGGASRRRTRHHHHQHRRKSVRRNKKSRKGRKAIKMHRTKHRVHRRKLNKSKTKQRK